MTPDSAMAALENVHKELQAIYRWLDTHRSKIDYRAKEAPPMAPPDVWRLSMCMTLVEMLRHQNNELHSAIGRMNLTSFGEDVT